MQPPLDGGRLLDEVHQVLTAYCALPSVQHEHAVVLWIATTHCLPAFDYAPRLVIRSAEKRSGKSRLLEVIDGMCHAPLRAVHASVAAIFRSLGGDHPRTLLLDEADTIFGSKKVAEDNEGLRGLLNAGFQRNLPVIRCDGPSLEVKEFDTFAMAALAGIGQMPDTIEDRAVVVVMRRRKEAEYVKPFRQRRDGPVLDRMRERLALWAAGVLDEVTSASPEMPVEDRAADTWEPLVAVADAAGGNWPERAREAASAFVSTAEEESTDGSLNTKLLSDIRTIFEDTGQPFLRSADLCQQLRTMEESPWEQFEMNPSKLGHRLREYAVRPVRDTTGTSRGYRLADFIDPFARYLPGKVPEAVKAVKQAPDLCLPSDALPSPDALHPSDDLTRQTENRRSEGTLTPSDGSGRGDRTNALQIPGRCSACRYDHTTQKPLADEWHARTIA